MGSIGLYKNYDSASIHIIGWVIEFDMTRMPYPLRPNGLPVSPEKLGLPPTRLDVTAVGNMTNHHLLFPGHAYINGGIILATLRDLASMQCPLAADRHNHGRDSLHQLFLPPRPPDEELAFDYIMFAFRRGERLRRGSFGNSELRPLRRGLIKRIQEYRERNTI